MTEDTADSGGRSRDESGRMAQEASLRDILDVFEKHGETDIKTKTVKEELGYGTPGMIKRLRQHPEYIEEKDLGTGNPILWSLKYDRKDFLDAFDALGDLTPPEEIAEHVGCPEEVAKEWLYKLKDEGELATHTRGEDISPLWSRMPD